MLLLVMGFLLYRVTLYSDSCFRISNLAPLFKIILYIDKLSANTRIVAFSLRVSIIIIMFSFKSHLHTYTSEYQIVTMKLVLESRFL